MSIEKAILEIQAIEEKIKRGEKIAFQTVLLATMRLQEAIDSKKKVKKVK